MQQINKPSPDMTVYMSGQIDIRTKAARRMRLCGESRVEFLLDDENNLYIRETGDWDMGIRPSSVHGSNFLRFFSVNVAKRILSLPDIPKGIVHAGFRIGEADSEMGYPVITRRVL